jgi:uncharacterized protein
MDLTFSLSWTLGLALCALAIGQIALWSVEKMKDRKLASLRFNQQQQSFREQLSRVSTHPAQSLNEQVQLAKTWRGFREFTVDRLVKETENTTSVYLLPADRKSIPSFRPGQHITLRLSVPGLNKPITRCYSLSDSPSAGQYRVSVKEAQPSAACRESGCGSASHYINHLLRVGQTVGIKAPAGEFFLNEESDRLVVLLAGGIGITPMVSMINHLAEKNSCRSMLLVHGVRHGQDHPFKHQLRELCESRENFYLVNCYSQPQATDQPGVDFQVRGQVSIAVLKKILQGPAAEFYLCGPPSFMKSLYAGLLEWGVDPADIHYEAFGSASLKTSSTESPEKNQAGLVQPKTATVTFARTGMTVNWRGEQSLLALAESQQIPVDSGCRAGSCGSCCVPVLAGQVEYPAGLTPDCPAGHCLMCIAHPKGAVQLDV